jgi:tRNA U34 5-methylaminomethyl-2-thiouridine-forming methyltransferase MnmC
MALISGKEVKKGPKQLPANPKMWNMLTAQARAKFTTYPSPAAAHWVRSRYEQMGGRMVDSKKEIDPKFRDYDQEERDKKEKEQKAKITKKVGIGNIRGTRQR